MNARLEGVQGIQSIEVGATLLSALALAGGPMTLSDLANATGMGPSKARRYLVSYARIGLVEQLENGGRYALGPMALRLGLAALGQVDVVRSGTDVIRDLSHRLNVTTCLLVWTERGPTAVRFERSRHDVTLHIRVGTVIAMLSSAVGRLFATYLPADMTAHLIEAELKEAANDWRIAELDRPGALEAMQDEIRGRGYTYADGFVIPGLRALAAPVFDAEGTMVASIVIFGPLQDIPADPDSTVIRGLLNAAEDLSARLGASTGSI